MADIKGIVVRIEGDANPLVKSLKDVEKQIKSDDAALKSLDKALKLDPTNVDLLAAKEKVLADKTQAMTQKMQVLQQVQKDALSDLPEDAQLSASQMAELDSAIASTAKQIESLDESKVSSFGDGIRDALDSVKNSEFGQHVQQGAEIAGKALSGIGAVAEAGFNVVKKSAEITIDVVKNVGAVALEAGKVLASAFADAGKAMVSTTMDTAKLADNIQTLSEKSGVATDTIQALNYAENLWDVSTDTVISGMTKLEKTVGKAADGNKAAKETFDKLGISITDSAGNIKDNEQLYWEAVDALGKVGNEVERDTLAMELFGRGGKEMNPIINAGSEGFREFAAEAERVGYVMNEETLDGFHALQDNMDRLSLGAQSVKQSVGQVLLPTLTELSSGGVTLLQDFAGALSQTGGDVEQMAGVVEEYAPKLVTLVENSLPQILNVVNSIISAVLPAIVAMLPTLIQGLSDIIIQLAEALAQNADKFMTAISALLDSLINGVVTLLPKLIPIAIEIVETLVDGIIDHLDLILDGALQIVMALANALLKGDNLTKIVNAAIDIVMKIALALLDPKAIKALIEGAKNMLVAFVKGLAQNIPVIIPAVVEAFATLAEALTDPQFLSEMISALVECLVTLADTIVENLPLFIQALVTIIGNIAIALGENFPMLIETALRLVGELIFMVFETIGTLLGFNLDEIFEVFQGAFDTICGIFEGIGDWFGDRWEDIKGVFSAVGEWFGGIFDDAWSAIKKPFDVTAKWFEDLWEDIKKPFAKVGEFFEGAFKTVGDVIKAPLNGIISGINTVIGALNTLSIDIPSWVPGIGGETWGIDIPKVPYLRKGGVLEKGQIGLLEGSGAEAVVPLENNEGWIKALASAFKSQLDYSAATQSNVGSAIDYTSSFQMLSDKISGLTSKGDESNYPPTFTLVVQLGQQRFAEMVAQAQADNVYYAGGY